MVSSGQSSTSWANFEATFEAVAAEVRSQEQIVKRRNSSASSSHLWMDHPVATSASVIPVPSPAINSRGNAVSMDRWSKHVRVKSQKSPSIKRSNSARMPPNSPSAGSAPSFPTEITLSRSSGNLVRPLPGPIMMVEAPKKTAQNRSRTTCSTTSSSSGSRNEPANLVSSKGKKGTQSSGRVKEQRKSDLQVTTSPTSTRNRKGPVERRLSLNRENSNGEMISRGRDRTRESKGRDDVGREKATDKQPRKSDLQVITSPINRKSLSERRLSLNGENSNRETTSRGRDRSRESTGRDVVDRKKPSDKHRRSRSTSRSQPMVAPPKDPITNADSRISSEGNEPSKTIETFESRRSSSQPRSSSTSRGRSTAIPPLTKENFRSTSRTRSSSLTRVTTQEITAIRPSSTRSSRPPPSTFRTQREMRFRSSPSNRRSRTVSDGDNVPTRAEIKMGSENSFDPDSNGRRQEEIDSTSRRPGLMEKLFGDHVEKPMPTQITGSLGYELRPRVLLAATVYHNTATSLWITTINTNQRGVAKNPATANKFLKAFSFGTEREARASAIANAPPKMIPFHESPSCFNCKGKFAVFRRASHCRNCGVCVCSGCATSWPGKSIPATYNLKNEGQVKVCQSCSALSNSFKKAISDGDFDEAVALYATGNVNLRTPFPVTNKKDELMWPVHAAVEGGNLNIIRWLVDDHFCPIKYCSANDRKLKRNSGAETAISTSKGRSVVTIALERQRVEIMRYLVVECGLSIYESKDLKSALGALEAALIALPPTAAKVPARTDLMNSTIWDKASFDDVSEPSSLGADDHHLEDNCTVSSRSNRSRTNPPNEDACILCRNHVIDCVATPCGHQVCCLDCSSSLFVCPVCNERGNFIKIYRP